jgi:hypothetical protein
MILDVILSNYRRPGNLKPQIKGIHRLGIPVRIHVIDNPDQGFRPLPAETIDMADTYTYLSPNPFRGTIRAMLAQQCLSEWVLIVDDDILPHPGWVHHALSQAQEDTGILCIDGTWWHNHPSEGHNRSRLQSADEVQEVHRPSSIYLCRREIFEKLPEAIRMHAARLPAETYFREDDIMMATCCALSGKKVLCVTKLFPDRRPAIDLPSHNSMHAESQGGDFMANRFTMIGDVYNVANGDRPLQSDKLRIKVVSFMSGNVPYFEHSEQIHRVYCRRHGYEYVADKGPVRTDRSVMWHKIPLILRELKDCDYLLFVDADAVFYSHELKIEDELIPLIKGKAMLMGADCLDEAHRPNPTLPNTGVILVRNCQRAREILEQWDTVTDTDTNLRHAHPPTQRALWGYVLPRYRQDIEVVMDYYLVQGRKSHFIRHFAYWEDGRNFTELKTEQIAAVHQRIFSRR